MNRDSLLFLVLNELCEDELHHSKRRKVWTKERYQNRAQFSHLNLMSELCVIALDDFKNFLRKNYKT